MLSRTDQSYVAAAHNALERRGNCDSISWAGLTPRELVGPIREQTGHASVVWSYRIRCMPGMADKVDMDGMVGKTDAVDVSGN